MLKIAENNGTEEIGLVTPTPDLLHHTWNLRQTDNLITYNFVTIYLVDYIVSSLQFIVCIFNNI